MSSYKKRATHCLNPIKNASSHGPLKRSNHERLLRWACAGALTLCTSSLSVLADNKGQQQVNTGTNPTRSFSPNTNGDDENLDLTLNRWVMAGMHAMGSYATDYGSDHTASFVGDCYYNNYVDPYFGITSGTRNQPQTFTLTYDATAATVKFQLGSLSITEPGDGQPSVSPGKILVYLAINMGQYGYYQGVTASGGVTALKVLPNSSVTYELPDIKTVSFPSTDISGGTILATSYIANLNLTGGFTITGSFTGNYTDPTDGNSFYEDTPSFLYAITDYYPGTCLSPDIRVAFSIDNGGFYRIPKPSCDNPMGYRPQDIDNGQDSTSSTSPGGVDYSSGQSLTQSPGLDSAGGGGPLSSGQVFADDAGTSGSGGWMSANFPTISRSPTISGVFFSASSDNQIFFQETQNPSTLQYTYTPIYAGVHDKLIRNGSNFTLIDSRGNQLTYGGAAVGATGHIGQWADPAGNVTSFSYDTNNHLTSITRVMGGTVETFSCTRQTSGVNTGKLVSETLTRTVGGTTTTVRNTHYTYYTGSYTGADSYGNQGDVQSVTLTDQNDHVIDQQYFRYYTPNDAIDGSGNTVGYVHGLKYSFDAKSYARLSTLHGDPTTTAITDSYVQPLATKHLSYDEIGHAVSIDTQGSGCSCSGSSGQGTYAYTRVMSGFGQNYNNWDTKTTETLPDGTINIVYLNYAGKVMYRLRREISATAPNGYIDHPLEYYRYNGDGTLAWKAEPSAIVPNSSGDYANELLGALLITQTYSGEVCISSTSGLIHVYAYGSSGSGSETVGGSAPGYLSAETIQNGISGTSIGMTSYTYYQHTAHDGTVTYPIATMTTYRVAGSAGTQTSYSYTWQTDSSSNTLSAMATRTMTRVPIIVGQNGPASSTTDTADASITKEYFDTYGHVIWAVDPQGYVSYTQYDIASGGMTMQVADCNPSLIISPSVPAPTRNTLLPTALHLITSYTVDTLGRTTAMTDPRGKVTYTTYDDPDHEVRVYPGWNGTGPTGPTQVMREDRANNYTETLTMSATPAVSGTAPSGTEAISNVQTLSRTLLDQSGRPTMIDRFFNLSSLTYSTTTAGIDYSTGTAVATELGTTSNYYRTTYGYDAMGRKARVVNAVGDVTRAVYDGLGRVSSVWMGTDDNDGDWNGANVGTANLTQITSNVYDNGGTGDSNLTQVTQNVNGSTTRVIQMYYDWRDRLVATQSGGPSATANDHAPIVINTLDNLGEVTMRQTYDGYGLTVSVSASTGVATVSDTTKLRSETATSYDDQGRVYEMQVYSVDQSAGTVSTNALTTNTFYDLRGNVIATYSLGGLVKKSAYDGAGRLANTYTTDGATDTAAGTTGALASASGLTGNNVLEEVDYSYDADGNVVMTASKSRNHDETATGALGTPTTSPKARIRYSTAYYDAANRSIASVAYGTTSTTSPTEGSSAPASSDTVLVTTTGYNAAGWAQDVTDPKAIVTHTLYDAAGRVTSTLENYSSPGTPTANSNRTTNYTYDGMDHTLTLTAVMPSGGSTPSQTTQYVYGIDNTSTVNGTTSGINSNSLLYQVKYPDKTAGTASSSASDQNTFTYDALGEVTTKMDQNATLHSYSYDVLGRTIKDAIAVASGNPQKVDTSVLALGISFDTAGRSYQLTSYADAPGTTIVNQVQRAYNGLGQLTQEYQAHSGAVATSGTISPSVQYAYTAMASPPGSGTYVNNSRLTSMTYPNGRILYYLYSEDSGASGVSDSISRVTTLASATTRGTNDANVIASYDYLGLSTVVRKNYPTSGIRMDRFGGTSGTYAGLDQFDRVISQQWTYYSPTTSGQPNATTGGIDGAGNLFLIGHGYDRDSNRLYASNATQAGSSHAYQYDNLNRLTEDNRGELTTDTHQLQSKYQGENTTVDWTLDPLGNPTTTSTVQHDWYKNTINAQNQITTRKVLGTYGPAGYYAGFYNSSDASNWTQPGSGDSFDTATTQSGSLTITGVSQDTIDGVTEPQAQTLLLASPRMGPVQFSVGVSVPATATTGEVGLVFGYKSGKDYWLRAASLNGHAYIYHVINGTKTVIYDQAWGGVSAGSFGYLESQDTYRVLNWFIYYPFSNGIPEGRIGLYSTITGVQFIQFGFSDNAITADTGSRWTNSGPWYNSIKPGGLLGLGAFPLANAQPTILKNLTLGKFQATFALHRDSSGADVAMDFLFNYHDMDNTDRIYVPHHASTTAAQVSLGSFEGGQRPVRFDRRK